MLSLIQNGFIHQIECSSPEQLQLAYFLCLLGCTLIPYLLGSINFAVLFSRLFFHEDIRKQGSGNAGATNMLRTYGLKYALLTLCCDTLKAVLSVLIGGCFLGIHYCGSSFFDLFSVNLGGYLGGFFCVVGHVWPVFYHFKGGKGVIASAVMAAMLSPFAFTALAVLFVIIVAMTKYVSLGSIVSLGMYPLVLSALFAAYYSATLPGPITLLSILLAFLVIWAHRSNIARLRTGEESRLSFRSKS